jgi:hypothetical protein
MWPSIYSTVHCLIEYSTEYWRYYVLLHSKVTSKEILVLFAIGVAEIKAILTIEILFVCAWLRRGRGSRVVVVDVVVDDRNWRTEVWGRVIVVSETVLIVISMALRGERNMFIVLMIIPMVAITLIMLCKIIALVKYVLTSSAHSCVVLFISPVTLIVEVPIIHV